MLSILLLAWLSQCLIAREEYQYEQYNLTSLCTKPGSVVPLYLGRQETVFSVDSPHHGVEDCHLSLRVFSDFYGQAVFIKKMRSDNCDSDYLQFGRSAWLCVLIFSHLCFRSTFLGLSYDKSQKYCENIDLPKEVFSIDGTLHEMDFGSTPYAFRSYVEESSDTMDIWISLSPQTHTEPGSVSFVVTPFPKECVEHDADYRRCPGSHSCVRRQLFCDGIVNCPHAWQESEETGCRFPHLRGGSFNNFPLIILILFLLLSIGSLILLGFKVKWDNSEERKMAIMEEQERIEKLFKVKVKKKIEDDQTTEASPPAFDTFLQEFYRFSALQAEECSKVDAEYDD